MAHAWYEPGEEHQGLPVRGIFTGDATDVAVRATVTLGNRKNLTERELCCQGHSQLLPVHPAGDTTTVWASIQQTLSWWHQWEIDWGRKYRARWQSCKKEFSDWQDSSAVASVGILVTKHRNLMILQPETVTKADCKELHAALGSWK